MNREIILIAFFASGFATLVYEMVWTRMLQLPFGSTVYSASAVLISILSGFASGSFIFRNLAEKKNNIILFAIIQISTAIYGIMLTFALWHFPAFYIPLDLYLLSLAYLLICFAILLIPSTLIGGTWPVMAKLYCKREIASNVGVLYFSNAMGCSLAPLFTGFLLIPALGLTKTSLIASIINLLLGISFAYLYIRGGRHE